MPKAAILDPWTLHVLDWEDCRRCPLSRTRHKIVLARGEMPCDVLFVGEGPGQSENLRGLPFVGPAGKVQDGITAEAIHAAGVGPVRVAYTNLVACIPLDAGGVDKTEEPPEYAVHKCAPRLADAFRLFAPRLVVCLGKEAHEWLTGKRGKGGPVPPEGVPLVKTHHPARLLHDGGQSATLRRQCVATLATAIRSHCGPMKWDPAEVPF